MWIYADKFSLSLNICNNIVDGNFCCCTCCCWYCDDRYTRFLCRSNAFETSYIFKLRICNDNSDCFGSIHGRSSANCDKIICTGFFECLYTMLYVFNGWVCFDIRISFISKTIFIKNICHFLCHTKFDQIWIGTYKSFFEIMCLCFICDLFNRTCSVIRCFV